MIRGRDFFDSNSEPDKLKLPLIGKSNILQFRLRML